MKVRNRIIAMAAGAAILVSSAVSADAAVRITSSSYFGGQYAWCWYGWNGTHKWVEIVPDGTLAGVPSGWCKIYYDPPLYREEFTLVAPNGARETYEPK
jgi:hypothetical protein